MITLQESPVQFSKDKGSAKRAQRIGQPIARIVACPIRKEGLMILVQNSYEREDEGDDQSQSSPARIFGKVESCREQDSASEEEAKVQDFVDMRDLERKEAAWRVKSIPVGEEIQNDEPENKTSHPKTRALAEGWESHH
jgi:hypothetical protein